MIFFVFPKKKGGAKPPFFWKNFNPLSFNGLRHMAID
jgi:hypothetical protein